MPAPDFTDKFNTVLLPEEEAQFQKWLIRSGRQSDLFDYDMRGAWKSGVAGGDGHLPDTYKKPNHPTFSNESQYSSQTVPGGEWKKTDGKWSFRPSTVNIQLHGAPALQDYFRRVEPDSALLLP